MKRHLIILNIVLLFIGNVLFPSIHLHEHTNDDSQEIHECLECIFNNNDVVLDYSNVCFLEFHFNHFDLDKIILNDFSNYWNNHSRAPPIS